ncbi:MAG: hypothetical protein M1825_002736 [Sarcosagium campestre]|nr:MAG: hypothetical protein M1825_002736 [Sarcosagium campestre]
MGWNQWSSNDCEVSEKLIVDTAHRMVTLGLRDLGYQYVVVDDCWQGGRNRHGKLVPDDTRFPDGMKSLTRQIHDMGLGFGIYSDAGTLTCKGYPGSWGYEERDARTFSQWGVDYLIYDNCFNEARSGTQFNSYARFHLMQALLQRVARPVLYAMCDEDGECVTAGFHCSAMSTLNKVSSLVDKGMPGAWNDLGKLEVGNGGMTDAEYKTQFSMWAAVKSPLMIGTDLRKINAKSLSIISNPAVIAVSQDPLGRSAVRRWRYSVREKDANGQGEIQMWSGRLSGGDYLVILLNGSNSTLRMNATLSDVFWDEGPEGTAKEASQTWDVYDLWGSRMSDETANAILENSSHQPTLNQRYNATTTPYAKGLAVNNPLLMGQRTATVAPMGNIQTTVGRHDVAMFRLRPHKREA